MKLWGLSVSILLVRTRSMAQATTTFAYVFSLSFLSSNYRQNENKSTNWLQHFSPNFSLRSSHAAESDYFTSQLLQYIFVSSLLECVLIKANRGFLHGRRGEPRLGLKLRRTRPAWGSKTNIDLRDAINQISTSASESSGLVRTILTAWIACCSFLG